MREEFSYLLLAGGLALFLYGLKLARIGLQEVSEDRLRHLIGRVTDNRFKGLGIGVLVTGVLQSSTATTVMLVGFAATGLITLTQAMGVILGADIGTTITVQLISFRLDDWSLLFIILGLLFISMGKETTIHHVGNIVLGFGFIFYGMNLMSQATYPLRQSQAFIEFLGLIGNAPPVSIFVAALFTAIVQSSAATIGLVLSLAQADAMSLEVAVPMVLGANIGTCGTALIAGAASEARGRQVAYAHLAFKVLGTLLIIPILPQFTALCRTVSNYLWVDGASVVHQIANAHTLFNIIISIAFLPFTGWAATLLQRLEPDVVEKKEVFRTRFLDINALDSPALAQGGVTREIMRAAEIVHGMFTDSLKIFETYDENLAEHIEEQDDRLDYLDKEMRFYLAKIAQRSLTREQAKRQTHLLSISTDLEHMGDTINRDLVKLAKKMSNLKVSFSEEGWDEIKEFHAKVSQNFALAVSAFADRNQELARKVVRHERTLGELEGHLKQNHLKRLQAGLKESFDTSSIHLELLSELRRINSLLSPLADAVLDQ